jgi:UDP-N-acetylmuramate--alanine ligase
MYRKQRNIHFVGIGGIGMSGIAEVLLTLGHKVSGSDLASGSQTKRLSSLGARIYLGHKEEQIEGADVVVVSSAVSEGNPEVMAARRMRIPVCPRAEMLSELMRLKTSIAVAGSHGKTTTCSLIGMVLTQGGLDPTLVIGGKLKNIGVNARLGQGEYLVAEADESDGSFLLLSPTVAVVTNIDREHMNHYGDFENLKETFLTFINKVPFYGASILCADDPEILSLIPMVKRRFITYGLSEEAIVRGVNVSKESWGHAFDLSVNNEILGRIKVNLPGIHNVRNSLAAAAAAREMGVPFDKIKEGVENLIGVGRRFEKKGEISGISVLDDYGHHPTEIRATLSALSEEYPQRRKLILFQPHRHTRTRDLFQEFIDSFDKADKVFLADIYSAGESPFPGIDSRSLAKAISESGGTEAIHAGEARGLPRVVLDDLKDGDVILTLGAGDIWTAGEEILKVLAEREEKGKGEGALEGEREGTGAGVGGGAGGGERVGAGEGAGEKAGESQGKGDDKPKRRFAEGSVPSGEEPGKAGRVIPDKDKIIRKRRG